MLERRHLSGLSEDKEHYCTLESVVPLGPHELKISVEVSGGDVTQADASLLSWQDAEGAEARGGDGHGAALQTAPCWSSGTWCSASP